MFNDNKDEKYEEEETKSRTYRQSKRSIKLKKWLRRDKWFEKVDQFIEKSIKLRNHDQVIFKQSTKQCERKFGEKKGKNRKNAGDN